MNAAAPHWRIYLTGLPAGVVGPRVYKRKGLRTYLKLDRQIARFPSQKAARAYIDNNQLTGVAIEQRSTK